MGHIKRYPELRTKEQRLAYERISKADIIEAFRDLFQEYGGAGETDEVEWLKDLQDRITLLKNYREQEKRAQS